MNRISINYEKIRYMMQSLIILVSISILITGKLYAQWTPLNVACDEGNLNIVKTLIKNGASVNERNPGVYTFDGLKYMGNTPLISVVEGGFKNKGDSERLEIIKLLLEHKADPNLMTYDGEPYPKAAIHIVIDDYWEEYTVNYNSRKDIMRRDLCNQQIENAVRLLLAHGANPNLQRPDGFTPLHIAAENGSLGITKLLLDYGADVRIADKLGETPLSFVTANGLNYNPRLESFYEDYLNRKQITITNQAWLNRHKDRFKKDFPIFLIFSILIAYVAVNIYMREGYYRDHPQDNWMGIFNSYLLIAGGLMMLFGKIGIEFVSKNTEGYAILARAAVFGFLGAVAGLLIGILVIHYGRILYRLKNNRILYYFATVAITAAMILLLRANDLLWIK